MIQNSRISLIIPAALVLLAALSISAAAGLPEPSASEQKLLSVFSKKAKDYMDRENSLAADNADKMKPTADVAKLDQQRKQLRDAVRQSRMDAKQGDFFTAQIAPIFRRILSNLFNGPDGAEIKASLMHAEPGAPAQFAVNGEFPNQNGQPVQSVPATVLQALPVLPKGLEYGIGGKTLALRDTSANMVVDYLPNALP